MPTVQAEAIAIALDAVIDLNGVQVTIASGERSVGVTGFMGQLNLSQFDNDSRRYRVGYQEFLFRTADLKWSPSDTTTFVADESFTITVDDIEADQRRVYEVLSPGGDEQPSRPTDPYRIGWRFHTQLRSETELES